MYIHIWRWDNIRHRYSYINYSKYAVVWKWLINWPLQLNKTTIIGQSTKTEEEKIIAGLLKYPVLYTVSFAGIILYVIIYLNWGLAVFNISVI